MKRLMNTSARLVTIPLMIVSVDSDGKKIRSISKRISFPPSQLVKLETDDWKAIKENQLIVKMLDNGEMLEGSAASRNSVSEESIDDELQTDLDNEGTE